VPSKNMMSDFAPEVAKYSKATISGVCETILSLTPEYAYHADGVSCHNRRCNQ